MSTLVYTESHLAPEDAIYDAVIPAGEGWFHPIKNGQFFRIIDMEGNQAADTFFFSEADTAERYSAQDTIREQGSLYLHGRNEAAVEPRQRHAQHRRRHACGRHDTIMSACAAESNMVRYSLDKRFMHACRDTFPLEMAKSNFGVGKRDLAHNINFFMNVPVTPTGALVCRRRLRAG